VSHHPTITTTSGRGRKRQVIINSKETAAERGERQLLCERIQQVLESTREHVSLIACRLVAWLGSDAQLIEMLLEAKLVDNN